MLTFWLAAAALAAQTTTATPQQQTSTKAPDKITITGCVERADPVERFFHGVQRGLGQLR